MQRLHLLRPDVPARPCILVHAAGSVSTNDFKNGLTVEIDGQPFRVMGMLQTVYLLYVFELPHSDRWAPDVPSK